MDDDVPPHRGLGAHGQAIGQDPQRIKECGRGFAEQRNSGLVQRVPQRDPLLVGTLREVAVKRRVKVADVAETESSRADKYTSEQKKKAERRDYIPDSTQGVAPKDCARNASARSTTASEGSSVFGTSVTSMIRSSRISPGHSVSVTKSRPGT